MQQQQNTVYLQYALAVAELYDLHVLVGVVDHAEVLHPLEPRRDVGGQVATEQLRRQRVEGADCDRHLHVHTARANEESNTLETHPCSIRKTVYVVSSCSCC